MSGVGEVALVLGLISSIIAIIDGSKKVYDAAHDASSLPEDVRAVALQLPLAIETLKLVQQAYQGTQSDETTKAVKPILFSCSADADLLKEIFDKVIPGDSASRVERYRKAMKAVTKGSKVQHVAQRIFQHLLNLANNQTFKIAADLVNLKAAFDDLTTKLETALEELAKSGASEGGNQFYNSGSGPMNNNTGSGEMRTYTNSSTGQQYNAETQHFGPPRSGTSTTG